MVHKTEIRVSWFDVDREDIVYYGNYFRFFTIAEEKFLQAAGITHNFLRDKFNVGLVRVKAECDYLSPVVSEDVIEVQTIPNLENNRVLKFYFRILRKKDQSLLAEGKVLTVCSVLKPKYKITCFPQEIFDRISSFIHMEEKGRDLDAGETSAL
jgi:acyl-CoA thioester hydrolase